MIARSRRLARVVVLATGSLLAAGACTPARAQEVASEEHRFRVVTVAEGLRNPWGMAFLPGGDVLVTEKGGRLRLVRRITVR